LVAAFSIQRAQLKEFNGAKSQWNSRSSSGSSLFSVGSELRQAELAGDEVKLGDQRRN